MIVPTTVEILDSSLNKICEVKNLVPLDKNGTVLRYSKILDNYGTCQFRINKLDPLFTNFGDVILPHKYHIRLMRGGISVWEGAITDNPQRNRFFHEVKGSQYEYYLDHVLIKRTSAVGYGEVAPTEDIGLHYRIFDSGTMSAAVSTIITETQARLGGAHLMSTLAPGTVTNPAYPPGFADSLGNALTGSWNFGSDVVMQFDYQSVLYAMRQFGINSWADFRLNSDGTFDFEPFIGNKNLNLVFQYGTRGNIVNYNAPRLGSKMVNDYYGIATSPDGTILHLEQSDPNSLGTYGLMEGALAFADVKDQNALVTRVAEQLYQVEDPIDTPMSLVIDENGYSIGQYDIGDLITVKIVDGALNYTAPKRIVGITTNVHNTGRELTTVQLNKPKQRDLGN